MDNYQIMENNYKINIMKFWMNKNIYFYIIK